MYVTIRKAFEFLDGNSVPNILNELISFIALI